MKTLILSSLLFLLVCPLYDKVPAIHKLTALDLPKLTQGLWLVNFYSPEQPDQSFKVQFKKAAYSLEGIVKVAAIDAAEKTAGIDAASCPLVRLYVDGKAIDYEQPIKAAQLVRFVSSHIQDVISKRLMTVTGSKLPQTISQLKKGKNKSGAKGGAKGVAKGELQAGVVRVASNFKTAEDIANPVQTGMSVLNDQVVSQK